MTLKKVVICLLIGMVVSACSTQASAADPVVSPDPVESLEVTVPVTEADTQETFILPTVTPIPEEVVNGDSTQEVTEHSAGDDSPEMDSSPEDWREWPVLPIVSERAKEVYEYGLSLGNDPHAFSVFGDCQSEPELYMGRYEDAGFRLPDGAEDLRETMEWYAGSFDRQSPTVKGGTTVAAILWEGWVDPETDQCEYGESPLECELRIHKPSIVFINLGTHWELRNDQYLRRIIDELIERGVVPIISTKADSREGDSRINEDLVRAADEYEMPMWNFWLAAQHLDNGGMIHDDPMYLTDDGLEVRRFTSLQALDAIRRQLIDDTDS